MADIQKLFNEEVPAKLAANANRNRIWTIHPRSACPSCTTRYLPCCQESVYSKPKESARVVKTSVFDFVVRRQAKRQGINRRPSPILAGPT